MSHVNQCDVCGDLIDAEAERLEVTCGLWKGDSGVDEPQPRDICLRCVGKNPALAAILNDLKGEPSNEPAAVGEGR